MNPDFIIAIAIAVSIIGTIAFAAGIAWVLGLHWSRQRVDDYYDHLDELFK